MPQSLSPIKPVATGSGGGASGGGAAAPVRLGGGRPPPPANDPKDPNKKGHWITTRGGGRIFVDDKTQARRPGAPGAPATPTGTGTPATPTGTGTPAAPAAPATPGAGTPAEPEAPATPAAPGTAAALGIAVPTHQDCITAWHDWHSSLSYDETSALMAYKGNSININNTARFGIRHAGGSQFGQDDPVTNARVATIEEALKRATVPGAMSVFRSFHTSTDYDRVSQLEPGFTFSDNGFASTTLNPQLIKGWYNSKSAFLARIKVPDGSHAGYIEYDGINVGHGRKPDSWSGGSDSVATDSEGDEHTDTESEMLLARRSHFRVDSIDRSGKVPYVELTLLGTDYHAPAKGTVFAGPDARSRFAWEPDDIVPDEPSGKLLKAAGPESAGHWITTHGGGHVFIGVSVPTAPPVPATSAGRALPAKPPPWPNDLHTQAAALPELWNDNIPAGWKLSHGPTYFGAVKLAGTEVPAGDTTIRADYGYGKPFKLTVNRAGQTQAWTIPGGKPGSNKPSRYAVFRVAAVIDGPDAKPGKPPIAPDSALPTWSKPPASLTDLRDRMLTHAAAQYACAANPSEFTFAKTPAEASAAGLPGHALGVYLPDKNNRIVVDADTTRRLKRVCEKQGGVIKTAGELQALSVVVHETNHATYFVPGAFHSPAQSLIEEGLTESVSRHTIHAIAGRLGFTLDPAVDWGDGPNPAYCYHPYVDAVEAWANIAAKKTGEAPVDVLKRWKWATGYNREAVIKQEIA